MENGNLKRERGTEDHGIALHAHALHEHKRNGIRVGNEECLKGEKQRKTEMKEDKCETEALQGGDSAKEPSLHGTEIDRVMDVEQKDDQEIREEDGERRVCGQKDCSLHLGED